MSITKERTEELLKSYGTTTNDTGSVEVQVAILTERIKNLTDHFNSNKKDFQSRRGLLMMVNRRRRLLKYLQNTEFPRYQKLIGSLGLRK